MEIFLESKRFKIYKTHIFEKLIDAKNPILELLSNYDELIKILELKEIEERKIEIIYNNRVKIDEILRNQEKDIFLKYNLENKIIPYFFYMCLLIRFNTVFNNYSYDINYCLKIINNYIDKIKKESKYDTEYKYISLILSKLNIDLINNCEEKTDELIKNIKADNISTILNINGIDKLNLNKTNIEKIKIDELYSLIICFLIKENKFIDYEYSTNILNQLKIESINITETIEKELFKVLNEKEIYIKQNAITNIKDLFDKNKINFLYILLKYILKNSIYLYKNQFLINTRKEIIKIIKSGLKGITLYYFNGNENKINYIIKKLCDSDYYYKKFIERFLIKLKQRYQKYNLDSKKDDIKRIDEFINNTINIEYYFKEFDKAKTKLISPIFSHIAIDKWPNIEKMILDKKLDDIEDEDKSKIIDYFKNKQNEKILLKIFGEDICDYYFEQYTISSINSWYGKSYKDAKAVEDKEVSINNQNSDFVSSDYEITKFIKKVEMKYDVEFIKELDNNKFIVGGKNNLNFLDKNFNINSEKINIIEKDNVIYNICERAKNEENTGQKIIICSGNETLLLTQKGSKSNVKKILKNSSFNCIEVRINNHIFCEDDGAVHYINLFDMIDDFTNKKNSIDDKCSYRGVIAINDNIVALTSNKILSKGEDKLIFYNIIPRQIYNNKIIYNYSFNTSPNGLTLIMNTNNNLKILLCACKKYNSKQKNGILLVIFDEENIEFQEKFYGTKNFEVYCFCQIYQKDKNILVNGDKLTDLFLVGGFDSKKGVGIIQLYKMQYSDDNKNIEIKFIQDILIDNIICKGIINCIIQTRIEKKILFSCSDGCIYVLTPPNTYSVI